MAVFAAALAYLLALRGYGFQLEDEGTVLFHLTRALRGERPYFDFHTGYTPGFFAIHTLFMSGSSAVPGVRLALVCMNALSAAGLCEITRRIAGPRLAAIPALLWLAFVPVYVGEFAAFNVPYPTWAVTLAWIASALVLSSWVERPRIDKVVAAGLLAAFALWLRPNSGAFLLAGATWVVCAVATRETLLDRLAAVGGAAVMAVGTWFTFQFQWSGMDAFVHLLPVLAVTVLVGGRDSHLQGTTPASCAGAIVALAASFLLPTLAWMVPLYTELGHSRFLFDVLLIGADYQSIYHVAHPPPQPYAVLVMAGCLSFAMAGRLVRAQLVPALVPAVVFACAIAGIGWIALTSGLAPEGTAAAVSSQLENASFWLALMANFTGLAYLVVAPGFDPRRSGRGRTFVVCALMAVAMYMQMFPRSDFMHQITAAPLTIVVAAALLARVVRWWARGVWPQGIDGSSVTHAAVWTMAALVLSVELYTNLVGPWNAWLDPGPERAMPLTLPLRVERESDDELDAIAAVVEHLHAHTLHGDPVWSFPATSGLLYAAQRANPLPHDYWFAGRPDHQEERRVLEQLQKEPPRYGVTLNAGWTFFEESPAYFSELRRFFVERYVLDARHGRFDVMVRRDVRETEEQARASPAAGGNAAAAGGTRATDGAPSPAGVASPEGQSPPRPLASPEAQSPADASSQHAAVAADAMRAAIEPDLQARRQAARRWMQVLTPEQAAAAALPQDDVDAVRLLRALRDGGDMRAAGWAILGYSSTNARVRREAVDAMLAMETSLRMHRLRLANDFDRRLYQPYLAPWATAARELLAITLLQPFAQAVIELAAPVPADADARPRDESAPQRRKAVAEGGASRTTGK
ncbi:MAG TPA: hypothetical protein VEC57_06420 [Candidatus Limnocylindrales bacterium]|nr:hypothetical protein [Candidatus Limnocylindrales bacterium]